MTQNFRKKYSLALLTYASLVRVELIVRGRETPTILETTDVGGSSLLLVDMVPALKDPTVFNLYSKMKVAFCLSAFLASASAFAPASKPAFG